MNASKVALVGPRRFQWNAGAWFGASVGSSAWMLVTTCFLFLYKQPTLATIPALAFAIVVTCSTILWSRRHYIYPFSAIMVLLGLFAFTFPVVWCVVQWYGSPSLLEKMNWPESHWITILVFAIVPIEMIWVFILERSGKMHTKCNHDSTSPADQGAK